MFLEMLRERIAGADLRQVKADVLPFIKETKELDIWSNDYFLQRSSFIPNRSLEVVFVTFSNDRH